MNVYENFKGERRVKLSDSIRDQQRKLRSVGPTLQLLQWEDDYHSVEG